MEYNLAWCLACLADQEWDERGFPCAYCFSERVTACTYNPGTVVLGGVGGTYTEYGTARPWQEQWYQTTVHFRELKAAYQPGGYRSAAVAKTAVEGFFEECLRLEDWLKGDAMKTPDDQQELKELFRDDNSLKLCKDIANTAKHRGRNKEGSRNAVVRRVYQRDDNSASAVIEWWFQGEEDQPRNTVDGLELAGGCMAVCKQFLTSQELRLWEVRTRKNHI